MVADEPAGAVPPDEERPGSGPSADEPSVDALSTEPATAASPGKTDGPRRGPLRWTAVGFCLLAPVIALLWVPWYNTRTPSLGGMPFFYWYQLLWVVITAVLMAAAYLLMRPGRTSAPRATAEQPAGTTGEGQR